MKAFELTILGCSSATPTSKRNPSSQFLNICDRYFLIDCGEGAQVQLRRFKLRFQKIDHILISHMHGDHFLGLPGLLQSMHLLGRDRVLNIYGPPEVKTVIDLINKVSQTVLKYEIQYFVLPSDQSKIFYEDEMITVESFPLNHRVPCTGFLFREKKGERKILKRKLEALNISLAEIHKLKKGFDAEANDGSLIKNEDLTSDPPATRSYAYCSDTTYFEPIIEKIKNVDLLYHESTFLEDMKDRAEATFHSTAKQAGEIALKAGVKKLILGHFSARYNDLEPLLKEASSVFENVMLATEGKKCVISFVK